jgi:hypothetical protein
MVTIKIKAKQYRVRKALHSLLQELFGVMASIESSLRFCFPEHCIRSSL